MATLIDNIGLLVTNEEERREQTHAAIVMDDGVVTWVGEAGTAPSADERIDADGRCVVPGFVDSHSHLIFAGDRSDEFEARMTGQRYVAGGIRRTVGLTRAASDAELASNAGNLIAEMRSQGTTTVEIKSGYGLTTVDEARALKVAGQFTTETTFLGAHVVPSEFADDPAGYVDLVTGDMLDACAPHAKWIDVFCDDGAFDVDQARVILAAGSARGLGMRMHGAQLAPSGAVQLAVEVGAASVDHCTFVTDADVEALAGSDTVATLLPGVEFSTRQPYPDGRRLIDAGATVAIACDCNPGSSFTSSMAFCIAVAVRDMHLSPSEALWSATAGGAAALRRTDIGGLAVGQRADAVILDAPSYVHLAYRPGVPLIHRVFTANSL